MKYSPSTMRSAATAVVGAATPMASTPKAHADHNMLREWEAKLFIVLSFLRN
jgi:hypothetical protein